MKAYVALQVKHSQEITSAWENILQQLEGENNGDGDLAIAMEPLQESGNQGGLSEQQQQKVKMADKGEEQGQEEEQDRDDRPCVNGMENSLSSDEDPFHIPANDVDVQNENFPLQQAPGDDIEEQQGGEDEAENSFSDELDQELDALMMSQEELSRSSPAAGQRSPPSALDELRELDAMWGQQGPQANLDLLS